MISMAAAELQFVGTRAREALDEGNLDAYDRWSTIADQLVDQLAASLDGRITVVASGRRCGTCGLAMALPVARAHEDCAVCRAVGGVWWEWD